MKSIHIIEDNLPSAWESSVLACWEQGDSFPTQYDKPGDENSRDVVALIHVKYPMTEPRIHRAFPGGLNDLEKYRAEVLYGVHDHWVNPAEGKWEYTYHQRLFEYGPIPQEASNKRVHELDYMESASHINQIEECIKMLKKCGFTRRAQAVTWKAWEDLGIHDPACLQRLWFRVEKETCPWGDKCISQGLEDGCCARCNGNGFINKLNMTVHMRSNDAYKAAFMNMYAFTELQAYVAERVGVEVGEYVHIADSYHIYGSYFDEFKSFLKTVESRPVEQRMWQSGYAFEFMVEGCEELIKEPDMPKAKKDLVRKRRDYLAKVIASMPNQL